jgi:glutamate racemase
MIKTPIGILDMGIDNTSILNYLASEFKSEHFIYVNDLECPDYEGLEVDLIYERVKNNVQFLMSKNVKLIIVVSNTIIEYCKDYFNEINVPVINIVDTIINYVNDNYEHKNMVFLSRDNIMKSNMYQKHLRYNHLYNIVCDKLDELVIKNKMKTNDSFVGTKEIFKTVLKKDVDIIIPTTVNIMLLTTEINEYMRDTEIVCLPQLFIEKIKAALITNENMNLKGKGKVEVYINTPIVTIDFKHLLKIKFDLKKRKTIKA